MAMDADAKNHEPNNPDCKRRTMIEVTIMDLPRVILVEIVSKLPIKSIFCCKCVCKSWYNLPSDPSFLKMFHPFPSLVVSSVNDMNERDVTSILELKADYDYNSCPLNRPIRLNTMFHLPHPKLTLMGSCNGFLCLLRGESFREHSVYISNPLLGEYFKINLSKRACVSYGFCFSEVSGQYKVLRSVITRFPGSRDVAHLEVYTLGVDKSWRNLGEVPPPMAGFGNVNVNGALHWISYYMMSDGMSDGMSDDMSEFRTGYPILIYSFDIETEKVQSLPIPPGLGKGKHLELGELENCLCLTDTTYCEQHIDIWWMKEYGVAESWTEYRILMDCIPPDTECYPVIPTLIWKDGEILIQNSSETPLVSYIPKENKFRKVNVYTRGSPTIFIDKYVPSFCSLNTIPGDNKVKNVYPQPKIV